MSADNGILVRKTTDDKYVSQMYFMSSDEWPSADRGLLTDTLEQAVAFWDGDYTEYGFEIDLENPVEVHTRFAVIKFGSDISMNLDKNSVGFGRVNIQVKGVYNEWVTEVAAQAFIDRFPVEKDIFYKIVPIHSGQRV